MEVKGIGEKLFLSLKPYVSVTGPTTLDSKVRLSSSPSAPRFLPGAGLEGETRQRRPGGQGTVTPTPARGPLGPGPSSHELRRDGARARRAACCSAGSLSLLAVPGALALRESVVDPKRGPRDDRRVLPRALVRDLPGPQRRPEVPAQRRPIRVGPLRATETGTASARRRSRAASTGSSASPTPGRATTCGPPS